MADRAGTVHLPVVATVPAEAGAVHALRAVLAGVAASAGADLEVIDDLRLAITEAAGCLLASSAAGPELQVTITVDGAATEVLAVREGRAAPWPPVGAHADLSIRVLEATVHDLSFDADDDGTSVRFVRRSDRPLAQR